MKELLLGTAIFMFLCMFGVIIAGLDEAHMSQNPDRYHYVDMNGKEGEAAHCRHDYHSIMTCSTSDGRKITVVEYWKNESQE